MDKASKIYKYLSEDEIEKLTVEVAKLGHVEAETTQAVLDEFYKTCLTQKVVTDGGLEYARTVLEKAFGESTANSLLQKVTHSLKSRSFGLSERVILKIFSQFFNMREHRPLHWFYLIPMRQMTAQLISELSPEKRLQVVESIARMESASPEAIKIVENEIKKKFSGILTTDYTTVGRYRLHSKCNEPYGSSGNEKLNLRRIGEEKMQNWQIPSRKKMFVFEDIITDGTIGPFSAFIRECDMKGYGICA